MGNLETVKGVGDRATTAITEDTEDMGTPTIDMTIKIEGEEEVKVEGSIMRIGDEVKKIFHGADEGNGRIMTPIIATEIIGIEIAMAKIIVTEVGDGTATGDRMTVIEAEVDNGINMINIPNKTTRKITRRLITTGPHQWVVSTSIDCRMNNTHPTHNSTTNIPNGRLHNPGKPQTYASCVKIKATMIINASSQVILWPEHKRRLIKAAHTATKNLLKESGQTGKTIMKTPMASFFSSGGSRCS